MYTQSLNLKDYLVSDEIIDWENPDIRQKALEVTAGSFGEVEKASSIYEWVRDHIPHSNDAGIDVVTCTASEVLQQKTGICFAKSHLLAALLRSINIPTGFCYQVLRLNPPFDNRLTLHGFNGIYLSSLDKWVRVDARGNTRGVNAQFDTRKEQLAFAVEPAAGEYMYDAIFPAPVPTVVEKLKKHQSRKTLWSDLPLPF